MARSFRESVQSAPAVAHAHDRVRRIAADVTSKDSIKTLVKEVSSKAPEGIQLLVNNAGESH